MTNPRKARAEAAFRKISKPAPSDVGNKETSAPVVANQVSQSRPVETTEGAMDEYLVRQKAERAKMAKLRAMRLAAEAKSGVKPKPKKAKAAPGGKGKRA
jgi:hypothetical protein